MGFVLNFVDNSFNNWKFKEFNFNKDEYDREESFDAWFRRECCITARFATQFCLVTPLAIKTCLIAVERGFILPILGTFTPLIILIYSVIQVSQKIFNLNLVKAYRNKRINHFNSGDLPVGKFQLASQVTCIALGILGNPVLGALFFGINLALPAMWHSLAYKPNPPTVLPTVNFTKKSDKEIRQNIISCPQLVPGQCIHVDLSNQKFQISL